MKNKMSDKKTSLVDMQIEDIAANEDVSIEHASEIYLNRIEHAVDLNNLPKVEHNWIKRGIKVSCEGANHPHHSHFLVNKR